MTRARILSLLRDKSGAAMLEFAMVCIPLLYMIFGFIDLAHKEYVAAILQGAVNKAGRTLSVQNVSFATQNALVQDEVSQAIPSATFTFSQRNFNSFAAISSPEPFIDNNNNGTCDAGEKYQDVDGNGIWDAINNGAPGAGGANAVVVYTVTVSYNHIFPIFSLFGAPQAEVITAQSVLRNQPYGISAVPVWRTC